MVSLLRYVDVIRFVILDVLHLLLIGFTSSDVCYISKSMIKHQ